jgi:hypothetical protein
VLTVAINTASLLQIPPVSALPSEAVAVMQDREFNLLLIRGDHSLNEVKTQKALGASHRTTRDRG